jgi:putative DNA primase/helicase
VPAGGRGFWRRVRKIDFKAQISGPENKRLVPDLLEEEGPAILAWMIDGARQVIAHGEQVPQQVMVATQQYRYEEDALARFLDLKMHKSPEMSVHRDAVYMVYRQWTIGEGVSTLPKQKFEREVLTHFPDAAHDSGAVYANYTLLNFEGAFGGL